MPHPRFVAYPRIIVAAYVIGYAYLLFFPAARDVVLFPDFVAFQAEIAVNKTNFGLV